MRAPAPPAFLPPLHLRSRPRFTCVPGPPAFPPHRFTCVPASPPHLRSRPACAFPPHRLPFHLHGGYFTLAARSLFRFTVPLSQPAALLPPPAAAEVCRTVSVLGGMCGYSFCDGGK